MASTLSAAAAAPKAHLVVKIQGAADAKAPVTLSPETASPNSGSAGAAAAKSVLSPQSASFSEAETPLSVGSGHGQGALNKIASQSDAQLVIQIGKFKITEIETDAAQKAHHHRMGYSSES